MKRRLYWTNVALWAVATLATLQLLLGGVVLWRAGAPGIFGGDFIAYYSAGAQVRTEGWRQLYDVGVQEAYQRGLLAQSHLSTSSLRAIPFNYPPPSALLFVPFSLLRPAFATLVWVILNSTLSTLALLAVAHPTTARSHGDSVLGAKRPGLDGVSFTWSGRLLCALLAFGLLPLNWGLLLGQPVGIVILCSSLAMLATLRGDDVPAGLWLGALAAFKPQLAIAPALVLLLKGRWRALAVFVGTTATLGGLTLALVGVPGALSYVRLLQTMDPFHGNPALAVSTDAMVGWRLYLVRIPLFDQSGGFVATTLADGVTIAVAVLVWHRKLRRPDAAVRAYVGILAAGLLGSYHAHYQDLVVLVPAALALPTVQRRVLQVARYRSVGHELPARDVASAQTAQRPGQHDAAASHGDAAPSRDAGSWSGRSRMSMHLVHRTLVRAGFVIAALLLAGAPTLAWLFGGILAWLPGSLWTLLAVPGLALLVLPTDLSARGS